VHDLPEEPVITTVTLAELSVGPLVATSRKERAARQAVLQQAEADFRPLSFDADAARTFGRVAASLTESGRKVQARSYASDFEPRPCWRSVQLPSAVHRTGASQTNFATAVRNNLYFVLFTLPLQTMLVLWLAVIVNNRFLNQRASSAPSSPHLR
jgi:ABC-type sugar transport system permease subunit